MRLIIAILMLCSFFNLSATVSAQFNHVKNTEQQTFSGSLILHNQYATITVHAIEFDMPRQLTAIVINNITYPCEIVGQYAIEYGCYQTGDHHYLRLQHPLNLTTGDTEINVQGTGTLLHNTDGPLGLFVVTSDNKVINVHISTHLKNNSTPTAVELYNRNAKMLATSHSSDYTIVPIPVSEQLSPASKGIIFNKNTPVTELIHINKAALKLGNRHLKPFQRKQAYVLTIRNNQIHIDANTNVGVFYALESLEQMVAAYHAKHQFSDSIVLPKLKIIDYPQFAYRGVLLDTSRNFFTMKQIKHFIDLMALHKLNQLHWHFSDDEGWRLQIPSLPTLTSVGATRGYHVAGYEHHLAPAYGSGGLMTQNHFYTPAEVNEIIAYAKAKNITVIPEIDTPGHARALKIALPDLFSKDDDAHYASVQGFNDDILNVCATQTYSILNHILKYTAQVFPSPYIHMGGDEVAAGAWQGEKISAQCDAFAGTHSQKELEHYFMDKMGQELLAQHKKLAAWDEVGLTDLPWKHISPDNVRLYVWHYDDLAAEVNRLSAKGYQLVLMPANYLYFDLAYDGAAKEPGYYWATGNTFHDTYSAFEYQPLKDIKAANQKQVVGLEAGLWAENLNSEQRLEYMAFPRLAALAELAWSPTKDKNWTTFATDMASNYLPMLDDLGVAYRLPPPGIKLIDGRIYMNSPYPGLAIHYSLNGAEPNANSPLYVGPIQASGEVRAVTCDLNSRCSSVSNLH